MKFIYEDIVGFFFKVLWIVQSIKFDKYYNM